MLQLLWINVIMDTFAAIALCSEPPRDGLMRKPPKTTRRKHHHPRMMLGNILITAAFFVVVMIALLLGMQHSGWFARRRSEIGRVLPADRPAGDDLLHRVCVLPGVEPDQLPVAVAGRIGSAPAVREPAVPADRVAHRGRPDADRDVRRAVFNVEPLAVVDWLVIAARDRERVAVRRDCAPRPAGDGEIE